MTDFAIETRSLTKRYDRFALGPLDLSVPRGAIYGLIGPNGAGKTTLIDMLLGMTTFDDGAIRILGEDMPRREVEIKRRVGYVSPDLNFQAWRRVDRLIQFHRRLFPDWDGAYCNRLLMALDVHPEEKILNLSFGAKIKLGLILALSRHPELLLLDEPTVGLDVLSRQQALAECVAAAQDRGCTVLISSHGLSDIERIASHVGFLRKGSLVLEGPIAQIIARFRRVEFSCANGAGFEDVPGLCFQTHEGHRWSFLLDTESEGLAQIKSRGGTDIQAVPVELEDVFISMMMGK